MRRLGICLLLAGCAGSGDDAGKEDDTSGGTIDSDAADTDPAPDTDAPPVADADADGTPDDADCAPTVATTRPGAVERPGNGVDDDCDDTIDEAPIPTTFRRSFVGVPFTDGDVQLSGPFRILPETLEGSITDGVLWLAEGGAPVGDPVGGMARDGVVSISLPTDDFDLRTLNPAPRQIWVAVQVGDDTYTGEMLLEFMVTPARTALTLIDGRLYGVIPTRLRFREGAALFVPDIHTSYGPEAELSPGIWSFATAPPTLSAPPYLLYYSAGQHPETGAEALWTSFTALVEGSVYRAAYVDTEGLLFYVTLTDLDGDQDIDVDDLALLDVAALPVP